MGIALDPSNRRSRQIRRSRRARLFASILCLASLATPIVPFVDEAVAQDRPPGLHLVGTLPWGSDVTTAPLLTVDPHRHLAYGLSGATKIVIWDTQTLSQGPIGTITSARNLLAHRPVLDAATGRLFFSLVDNTHHLTPDLNEPGLPPCNTARIAVLDGPGAAQLLRAGGTPGLAVNNLGCMDVRPVDGAPGVAMPPIVRGMSFDAEQQKLYVMAEAGLPGNTLPTLAGLPGVGQIKATRDLPYLLEYEGAPNANGQLALNWQVDLGGLGRCERIANGFSFNEPPIVGRHGNALLSYCYVGNQGRAVRIPLSDAGRPRLDNLGDPLVEISPTVGAGASPVIDTRTGRILIQFDDPPLGPAVWVYDAAKQRFVGLIPSGVPRVIDGRRYEVVRGFDPTTGRAYLAHAEGMVMASVRETPLPGGVRSNVYRVPRPDADDPAGTSVIGIDGTLRRLLVPSEEHQAYLVIEDALPDPQRFDDDDPDQGTANIPEVEGETQSRWSGAGNAFGARLLWVGGPTNVANNADRLCTDPLQGTDTYEHRDEEGRCPAERILPSGNRHFFVAPTDVEFGSESGTAASAAAAVVANEDSATDSDLRSIAACLVDRVPRTIRTGVAPGAELLNPDQLNTLPPAVPNTAGLNGHYQNLRQLVIENWKAAATLVNGTTEDVVKKLGEIPVPGYDRATGVIGTACKAISSATKDAVERDCGSAGLPEPARTAVHGACLVPQHEWEDGTRGGQPTRLTECTDFVGEPATDREGDLVGDSDVMCDYDGNHALASAGALPLQIVDPASFGLPPDLTLAVASATSSVETKLTDRGMETISRAEARGIQVGPFSIGRAYAELHTWARGQEGTNGYTYVRDLAEVHGPGVDCTDDCVDEEQQFVDAFNQFFQGRLLMRLPEPGLFKSPLGYQAVSGKEADLQQSDSVVNDDDTTTFNALDIMFVNDVSPSGTSSAGKSRLIVSLAGVQGESRYGIIPGFVFSPRTPTATASIINPTPILQERAKAPVVLGDEEISFGGGPGASPTPPLSRAEFEPGAMLQRGWEWLFNHPLQALLLLGVFSILLSPIYFANRRRVLQEALTL